MNTEVLAGLIPFTLSKDVHALEILSNPDTVSVLGTPAGERINYKQPRCYRAGAKKRKKAVQKTKAA